MKQLKIAVFVGSLRKESFNLCLARAVQKLAPTEFTFQFVRIDDLPLYSQEMDADYPLGMSQTEEGCGISRRPAIRDAGVQSVDSRGIEERDRYRVAAVGVRILLPASLVQCSARPSAPPAHVWRSSIYATSWPTRTFRRWANRKSSSISRMI